MSPQLTLQTPLQLPPKEIPSYLEKLWSSDQLGDTGANTFSLLVWQPAWLEQQLIRTDKIGGPILGTQREEIIEAARQVILETEIPHSTSPLDKSISKALELRSGKKLGEDLRGQHVDAAISSLQPRRLITFAPTIKEDNSLETLVAAYCPLPEESDGDNACGDVVVLRGSLTSLNKGLGILQPLLLSEIPSWLWWNGCLDEATDLLTKLSSSPRRLIIDTSLGNPTICLDFLQTRIKSKQAVNDLNWLRLRSWRETLAMVFDPPNRRQALHDIVQLDIDIEGENPVQGLLLAAWIVDRLKWKIKNHKHLEGGIIDVEFMNPENNLIHFKLNPLPVGRPSIHPGQIVGIRLICNPQKQPDNAVCVILGSESGECMRLEAGGMASMELIEEVVPLQQNTVEMDVARLLKSSRGSTSPLLESAIPIAAQLLKKSKSSQ